MWKCAVPVGQRDETVVTVGSYGQCTLASDSGGLANGINRGIACYAEAGNTEGDINVTVVAKNVAASAGAFSYGLGVGLHYRRIIGPRHADGQSGRVARDQIVCVLDGVGEHVGDCYACCQRVGRIGDVAVAAVSSQCQVTVAACQRGGDTCALRDCASTSDGTTDHQHAAQVVDIGVSASTLDHAGQVGSCQRGVFRHRAHINRR